MCTKKFHWRNCFGAQATDWSHKKNESSPLEMLYHSTLLTSLWEDVQPMGLFRKMTGPAAEKKARNCLTKWAMSSPGHEIQSFFTSYLVPHFSEVWKCGKVRQSKDIVALSPSHEPFVILYLVLHFSEVWKCGKVGQRKDIVALLPQSWTLCHSLLCSTLLRGLKVWSSLTK